MHTPVLLQKVIEGLQIKPGGLYIDATFGEGGHTQEILKEGGRALGIDWDIDQIQNSKFKSQKYKNLILENANFAQIKEIAKKHNFLPVDGILFDLGLSVRQIKESKRGFSYERLSEPLDMRMSLDLEKTAADFVNNFSAQELYEIFTRYSEELNSWAIAYAVVRARTLKKIKKVGDLVQVIDNSINRSDEKTYARIFQALRIAVNNEFENLKKGLKESLVILKKHGRIVIITFHSLEDRIVKNFIKENKLKQINKKLIISNKKNKFERSAKLRIISLKESDHEKSI